MSWKKKEQCKPSRGLDKRVIGLEKRTAEQEQYSRRECMELVGLPENVSSEDLEELVVEVIKVANVKVKKWDFHAIYCLANKRTLLNFLTEEMLSTYKQKKAMRTHSTQEK